MRRETLNKIKKGLVSSRNVLRKHLVEQRGHQCEQCKITEWNNKPTPITIHHVDGDASNNFPSNLQILCPNCHAQTPNFTNRNKGKGRKSRGIIS